MLPIYKDPDTDEWYYDSGDGEVGPYETFELAASAFAQAIQSCKTGVCE